MKNLFYFVFAVLVIAVVSGGLVIGGMENAPAFMISLAAFFEGYTVEQIVTFLLIGALFLVPQLGVNFLQFIKNYFQVEDDEAHKMVLLVLTFGAGILLLITGAYDVEGMAFTFNNLVTFIGEAYLISQYTYKRLYPKG